VELAIVLTKIIMLKIHRFFALGIFFFLFACAHQLTFKQQKKKWQEIDNFAHSTLLELELPKKWRDLFKAQAPQAKTWGELWTTLRSKNVISIEAYPCESNMAACVREGDHKILMRESFFLSVSPIILISILFHEWTHFIGAYHHRRIAKHNAQECDPLNSLMGYALEWDFLEQIRPKLNFDDKNLKHYRLDVWKHICKPANK
jgi:hypothetical protein